MGPARRITAAPDDPTRWAGRRVLMLSVHTSPLEQPGTGDAGGMNVYVVELSRRLAALGVSVEVFTRRTAGAQADVVELAPGVLVRHVDAGPYEGLAKEDLPGQLCAFTAGLMRAAAEAPDGYYDLVHSHYWLSGQVGWLFAERWGVPLVHTMHTMAKVKNAALAAGDVPEPRGRVIGEQQVVEAADRLVANTAEEAADLVRHYGADPATVAAVPPGVDLDRFRPGDRGAARARLGLPADADVLLFVGRIQPLKAPDVLVAAAARLRADRGPGARPLVVAVLGGPSGSGLARPTALLEQAGRAGGRRHPADPAARATGGAGRLVPRGGPGHRAVLQRVLRAGGAGGAGLRHARRRRGPSAGCARPSATACPGFLVAGPRPAAVGRDVLGPLLADPGRRAELGAGAVAHAGGFGWQVTAERVLREYDRAEQAFAGRPGRRSVGGPVVAAAAAGTDRTPPLGLLEASG